MGTVENEGQAVDASAAGVSAEASTQVGKPPLIPSSPTLKSLASRYDEEQHSVYLRHLQDAVKESRNLNIALTGRYGTGKSSVLDEFEAKNQRKTIRIAISTLGPTADEASLTNQIQKELVKQLLYRGAPREFRFSRFNRIVPLSRTRAVLEAIGVVVLVAVALALLGWLPTVAAAGSSHYWLVRGLAVVAVAAPVVGALALLRVFLHRFNISDVSAAGTAVKFAPRVSAYFDEYVEDIVYIFDTVAPRYVIFEDLDRFDDPHIFEALRELNTLLNQTPARRKKNRRVRFIYAIKDSLFERLGELGEDSKDDAVAAETVRANRTKFFDVVIPIVPFISHRNARELLDGLMKEAGINGVDRRLVALVARHATDMRLLQNICNEYLVFAQRLLTTTKIAPGVGATNLFALVVYKNFHLKDFENIARRESNLDELYELRRKLVRTSVDRCEQEKRDLRTNPRRGVRLSLTAKQAGAQLVRAAKVVTIVTGQPKRQYLFIVGGNEYTQEAVTLRGFWASVAQVGEIALYAHPEGNDAARQHLITFNRDQLNTMFPNSMSKERWAALEEEAIQETLDQLDRDIALLRGADFSDLVENNQFTLELESGPATFLTLVHATLKSKLACAMVAQGFLDRNFALYAAQFYGDFTGVDVANFIVQHVETNTMDIDYTFSGSTAIANLLSETEDDFCRTVSAYNIQILDYLLEQRDDRADDVADTVASNFGEQAKSFLSAYFNSGKHRSRFAGLLAKRPWRLVFTQLVRDTEIPADIRPELVSAALQEAVSSRAYDLGNEVIKFIVDNYLDMDVFTAMGDDATAEKLVLLIREVSTTLPKLAGITDAVRKTVVREKLYDLTADNLRAALGVAGEVSFDRTRENSDVYELCLDNPDAYLTAMEDDGPTDYTVLTEQALTEVLKHAASSWEPEQVRRLVASASPSSRLVNLGVVPPSSWPDLAAHHLFKATAENVWAYIENIGAIDASLAGLLRQSGRIDLDGAPDEITKQVAVKVLNAREVIAEASIRVSLVVSLELSVYISASEVQAESGDLLALLLEHDVVKGSIEVFTQFSAAGWTTLEPAIAKSSAFVEFMTPELVSSFVSELLTSGLVPEPVKDKVMNGLAEYVADDDFETLSAAGRRALAGRQVLPVGQVKRIAAATEDKDLVVRLLLLFSPLPPAIEIVNALAPLGEPYSFLSSHAKLGFVISGDEAHRTIFDHLKAAGVVRLTKKRLREAYSVKIIT
ncbi:hypothetical protein [Lentzea kentuckyensis]|uniref:YobI family P-loop NTPase n=1 Tax=Lentzea kentuckyensis TaxID=360086 RepID=UPI001179CD9F|nr:hypothetical protein [Lentzea kentuckyensis]